MKTHHYNIYINFIFIFQPNRINISQDKDVKFKMKEYLPL